MPLGAILKQNEQVIEYASRVLTPRESKYCTYELECLAIVFDLKKFREYLIGKRFDLFSDHETLKWIINNKTRNGRIGRWVVQMSEFYFDIHLRGKLNGKLDAISRIFV